MKKYFALILSICLFTSGITIFAEQDNENILFDETVESMSLPDNSYINYSVDEDGTINEYFGISDDDTFTVTIHRTIETNGDMNTKIYKDGDLISNFDSNGEYEIFMHEVIRQNTPSLICDSSEPNYSDYSHFFQFSESCIANKSVITSIKIYGATEAAAWLASFVSLPAAILLITASKLAAFVSIFLPADYMSVTLNAYDVYSRSTTSYLGMCYYLSSFDCYENGNPKPGATLDVHYYHTW